MSVISGPAGSSDGTSYNSYRQGDTVFRYRCRLFIFNS